MRVQFASALLAAVACIAFAAGPACAQQRFKLEITQAGQISKYINQAAYDVGDQPGHQVRIYKLQRTYTDQSTLVVRSVRVVSEETNGYSDYINGVGANSGYTVWNLADGGKIFMTYSGTASSETTATGSRRGVSTGAVRIVGGTGAWKSIRGTSYGIVKFDTDPANGYSQSDTKGEYWFEE